MKIRLTLLVNDAPRIRGLKFARPLEAAGEFELDLAAAGELAPGSAAADLTGRDNVRGGAGPGGAANPPVTTDSLLKLLGVDPEKETIFVIINKKITFGDSVLRDGDHVELIAAVDGG